MSTARVCKCGHPDENHLPRGEGYMRGACYALNIEGVTASSCECKAYNGPMPNPWAPVPTDEEAH